MGARVAQVVYTLTEFDSVNAVTFWMEGQPSEALGGEGLILDQPQTRADWADFAP
jgi:spore germination protein GerM